MKFRALHATSGRLLALLTLAAALLIVAALTVRADQEYDLKLVPSLDEQLTTLTIEGAASRSVSYDGAVGRFTVSVLEPTVLEAVSAGNTAVKAIADSVDQNCHESGPDDNQELDAPICVSPNGLQTTRIRIHEEFDWTERGRVSQGFRYENGLSIAVEGTDFAGGLVDLVIQAGGDHVRFDGLDFTATGRAEAERLALLDAIDDAQATADSIAAHMGYEIVRIVELNPVGSPTASQTVERAEFADSADEGFEPTPVFGGSESVTSRVRMVFELRPMSGPTPDSTE